MNQIFDDNFLEFIDYVEDNVYLPIPRNIVRDQLNPLEKYTNSELVQRTRFSGEIIVRILLPLIYPPGNNIDDNRGLPIPPSIKLYTALRFFATGSYQRVCGDLSDISQASVSRIVNEVSSELLAQNLQRFIRFPANQNEFRAIKQSFYNLFGFPGVIGCVDGTHVEIKSPGGPNAEIYRNRKGWMSLNVQVVSGPQQEILDIVIRWPGSAHDSRIFSSSSVHMRLVRGDLPGILLGDSAYAQTRYVYTPLLNTANRAEQRYNAAHIRTRNVVERTFGIWKGRFRCLVNALQLKLQNSTRVIAATAVLHNIAVRYRQQFHEQDFVIEDNVPNVIAPNTIRGNAIKNAFIQRHFT